MKHIIPYLAILFVIIYAFYNAGVQHPDKKKKKTTAAYKKHVEEHAGSSHTEEELSHIHTVEYAKAYIVNVIKYGSQQFDFPGGEMEGGFISPKDAPKVACYVLSLSDQKCREPYPEDAAMFYTSVCAGCHGIDGKGLGGSYPDLTKKPLLGIKKREDFLNMTLHK